MAVVVVLVAIGLGTLFGVIAYEWRDGRQRFREFEQWDRARKVTGHVGTPKRW